MASFKTSDHKAVAPTRIFVWELDGGEGAQIFLLNAPTVVPPQWLFINF